MNYAQHDIARLARLAKHSYRSRIKERVSSAISLSLLLLVLFGVAALFHQGTT